MKYIDRLLCLIGVHMWTRRTYSLNHHGEYHHDIWTVFDVCHCGKWKFIRRNCYDGIGIQPETPWPRA